MSDQAASYKSHLTSSNDLVTDYEATRAGFVALALERNRQATPYVQEARALQVAASVAKAPADLLRIAGIESGLLTAAGVSDKALVHLSPENRVEAINGLIKNFLEPAGEKFVEELVFRYLLTRGDTLGGSMRNLGGVLAQRKLSRAIISSLKIAGVGYQWKHSKSRKWIEMTDDDSEIELSLRGLSWQNEKGIRTMLYNLTVPLVQNNIDISLFSDTPDKVDASGYKAAKMYTALGELKGGIDPAGADEHWKTARTALDRIRGAFQGVGLLPYTFFIGGAIEKKMAQEIWDQLEKGILNNAANLNDQDQLASISLWIRSL